MRYEVVIIGGGAAGLTAGMYCSRNGLRTLLLERETYGGKLNATERIENFPGFPGGIESALLSANMLEQGLDFGLQVKRAAVEKVDLKAEPKLIVLDDGAVIEGDVVIIATGSHPRRLGVVGEDKFNGQSIHYCAVCDGPLYADKEVVVIGGGNSALEESLFLQKFVTKITIVHQRDQFTGAKQAAQKVLDSDRIDVVWQSRVSRFEGDDKMSGAWVRNLQTDEERFIQAAGAFIFTGNEPETRLFVGQVELDPYRFIITDRDMRTNIPGVFAAGDVASERIRQIATAVGDGATAAVHAEKYLTLAGDERTGAAHA